MQAQAAGHCLCYPPQENQEAECNKHPLHGICDLKPQLVGILKQEVLCLQNMVLYV